MVFGFGKDSGAGIKEKSKQRVEEDAQREEGQRRDAERKDINDPGTDEGHASLMAVQLEPIPPVGRGFSAVVAVLDTGVPVRGWLGTAAVEGMIIFSLRQETQRLCKICKYTAAQQ